MSQPGGAERGSRQALRDVLRRLMSEQLEPGRAAAAVGVGVTLGIVPVYGVQSILAVALATLMGLNRPLTLAATFINNPLLQPLLIIGSLQLGHLATRGSFVPLSPMALSAFPLADHLQALVVGSVILSAMVGGAAAVATYCIVVRRAAEKSTRPGEREWRAFVNERFRTARRYDRGFVRWKTRLDRIFALLLAEDLGEGPAVDLGCGHGATLALVAFRDPHRTLYGCDLDERRIEAAGRGLADLDVHLSTADVRTFPVPAAGLILIIDVLQYLDPADQTSLLRRCSTALLPGGRLIFRLPDTTRGFVSWTTRMLDRLNLRIGGSNARLAYLPTEAYTAPLVEAGLSVDVRSYRNRLPLRHIVIAAQKPGVPR